MRVGADVYNLYPVVDVIAHEYEFGEGGHMAAERKPLDWFNYQVGMHSFRAFAEGKPTWILNYSWDGQKKVSIPESIKNLAMSEVMANSNFWDAPGHSMAGSNDYPTRRQIFAWIKANEKTLYDPRTPISPVGVYFSPKTRDYYADEFLASYRGVLILLMQKHLEFQVVTPRTLAGFSGSTLVIPNARVLDQNETSLLRKFADSGKRIVVTGEDATGLGEQGNVVRMPKCPGTDYYSKLEKDFASGNPDEESNFFENLKPDQKIAVTAGNSVATSIANVDGSPHVYLANFTGLVPNVNPVQTPQTGVQVKVQGTSNTHGMFLPFLGQATPVNGTVQGDAVTFTLPKIEKGAVFWLEP